MRHVSLVRSQSIRAALATSALLALLFGPIALPQTVRAAGLATPRAGVSRHSKPTTTAQASNGQDVPSMDNDTLTPPPPPLPAGWPVGAKDAQFRGAACDEGY